MHIHVHLHDKTKSSLKNDTNFCSLFTAKPKKKKKGKTAECFISKELQLGVLIQFYANKQPGDGTALNSAQIEIWMILLHQEFHL